MDGEGKPARKVKGPQWRGPARTVLRAMYGLEIGRSFAPLRESGRVFGSVWMALRESIGRAKGAERHRRVMGPGAVVVLVLAGAAVLYGAVKLVVAAVVSLVPEAHAQVVDSGFLAGSDARTKELLDFLFGIARGDGYGVEEMLRFFNMGVLVVVGTLTVYHVLFAVVETGRTGKAGLGGWQMMRLVLGLGLVFPLPATGLGPAQHVVLELVDVGGGLAAGVWSRFAGVVLSGGSGAPVRIPPRHRGMVGDVVLLETCMYIHNEVAAAAGDGPYITVQWSDRNDEIRYLYADPLPWDRHWPCGAVWVEKEPDVANKGARMMAVVHDAALRAPAMVAGFGRAARELGDRYLVDRAASGEPLPDVDEWLDGTGLVQAYTRALEVHVAAATDASRATMSAEVEDAIARRGWLGASAFFLVMSRNHAVFLDAIAAIPQVRVRRDDGGVWGRVFDRVVEPWGEVAPELSEWLSASAANEAGGRLVPTQTGGFWSGFLDVIPSSVVTSADGGNPLEELVTMGHWMMGSALTALGAQGLISRIPGVGEKLSGGGFVTAVAVMLLIGGISLAYIVPAMPFLRSLFGILTWVISVVEAVIAVPLFFALQVGGQEQRLVSRASYGGYLLVLHAVLRPALMILGLVFGYFVFLAVMELFNWLYADHLQGLTKGTHLNPVTALVSMGMYVVIALGVANAAFKCVDLVPQEVLRWLGSRVRSGSDDGEGISRSLQGVSQKLSVFRGVGRGG